MEMQIGLGIQSENQLAKTQYVTRRVGQRVDRSLRPGLDGNLRSQMLASTEQQLVNDVAWLPMYQADMSLLIKPYMTYLYTTVPTTPSPDDWNRIYVAAH